MNSSVVGPNTPEAVALTPAVLSRKLLDLYPQARGFSRFLLRWRPFICPFDEVLRRIPPGRSMLDAGCGIGAVSALSAAYSSPGRVLGFDVGLKAVAVAESAALPPVPGGVEFRRLDATEWPDGRFGVVLAIDVLHHVPPASQREFIQRLVESTADGGRIVFKDISPKPWWKAAANSLHDLLLARQIVHYRPESQVHGWIEEMGLRIVEHIRVDRLWYSHYLIVAER